MNTAHVYLVIYAVVINSLSAGVKITGTAYGHNMLGEKYYHNKSIKAFLGHSRERKTASRGSEASPQRAAHVHRKTSSPPQE